MSTLPLASTTPGLADALVRYELNKKPYVQAEYDKFVEFIRVDMANMTELNNFTIVNDYDQLNLSFVAYEDRILSTIKLICNKLRDILISKGYTAEIQPYQPTLGNLRDTRIAYTISAANPQLFY